MASVAQLDGNIQRASLILLILIILALLPVFLYKLFPQKILIKFYAFSLALLFTLLVVFVQYSINISLSEINELTSGRSEIWIRMINIILLKYLELIL